MKSLALALLAAAAVAAAACKKPLPAEPAPDYDAIKSRSDGSHKSLDKETAD